MHICNTYYVYVHCTVYIHEILMADIVDRYSRWNIEEPKPGMAATLDTIAEQPGVEAERAKSLHKVGFFYFWFGSQ